MDNVREKKTMPVADSVESAMPKKGRAKPAGKKAPSRTLAGQVYERLREDIINGKLPPNMKLKLEQLISDYNVGMSPLREALSRLVGDMLVRTQGQRGFWVAPLSLQDLDDIIRIQVLLETQAVTQSIQNGGQEWVDRIEAAYADLAEVENNLPAGSEDLPAEQALDWERRNKVFHAALISACGSEWLLKLRGIMYQQLERYRRISLLNSRGRRDIAEEHQAIYRAVTQRKVLRASDLLEMHLRETAREVSRAIMANPALLSQNEA